MMSTPQLNNKRLGSYDIRSSEEILAPNNLPTIQNEQNNYIHYDNKTYKQCFCL